MAEVIRFKNHVKAVLGKTAVRSANTGVTEKRIDASIPLLWIAFFFCYDNNEKQNHDSVSGEMKMKYFQNKKNRMAPLLLSVCIGASLCSCAVQNDRQAFVAAPVVTPDKTLPGESKTRWDCVCFGSYPMSEVVESAFSAVDGYALREGDIIMDPGLYEI